MQYKIIMGIALVGVMLSSCSSHKVYKESTMLSKPHAAPKINRATQQKYLDAINKVRAEARSCGSAGSFTTAAPLRWSRALYSAAYEHSNDMLKSNHLTHKGSGTKFDWTARVQRLNRGSHFKERIENNGYKQWKNIAENIALGSSTIDAVMLNWIKSDYHCANIMNPEFTDVGMAYTYKEGSKRSHYWTQNFAAHQ
ncbi:MAG: hypothetical protein COA92_03335 [Sulfurovum sp.]|nr:MAG: hypothetical protein COA92_03335 [Sulfurovum sp.]